jgi:thioredoxin-like negative regulator of GroEL
LTAAELASKAAAAPVFVAHLGASWDLAGASLSDALARAVPSFEGRVGVAAMDVDDPRNRALLERLGLRDVPALACFVRGELTCVLAGPRTEGELRELFLALLAQAA